MWSRLPARVAAYRTELETRWGLAGPVAGLVACEQLLAHNRSDPSTFALNATEVPRRYAPEARQLIEIPAFSVPGGRLRRWSSRTPAAGRGAQVDEPFFLLVHPYTLQTTRGLRDALGAKGAVPAEPWFGLATSSIRTLVAWQPGRPQEAVLAKLSLSASIGGQCRRLDPVIVARSIGTTRILDASRAWHPKGFRYFPETEGSAWPDEWSPLVGCGSIHRDFPDPLGKREAALLPIFSLFASLDGAPPLLATFAKETGGDPYDSAFDHFVEPMVEHWIPCVGEQGFHPEPHAQNVLVSFDAEGRLTRTFYHRDFESFYVELAFRARNGLPLPAELPHVGSIEQDYKQARFDHRVRAAIDNFMRGSLIYNLHRTIDAWQSRGLLSGPRAGENRIVRRFKDLLGQKLSAWSGLAADERDTANWAWRAIQAGRSARGWVADPGGP